MRPVRIALSGAVAAALVATACSSSPTAEPASSSTSLDGRAGGPGDTVPGRTGASGSSTASSGANEPQDVATTFAVLLSRMPTPPDGAILTALHYPDAKALSRVGRTDVGPDEEVFVSPNTLGAGVPLDWATQGPDVWETSLGVGFRAFTMGAELSAPPRSLTRLEGALPAEAMRAAITADGSFGADYDVVEHAAAEMLVYRGEELRVDTAAGRSTPERLNRPMRFALSDTRFLIARTTADLEGAIDAERSPRATPGHLELLGQAADAVGAVELLAEAVGGGEDGESSWTNPLFVVGVGSAKADTAPAAFIVLVTPTEAEARTRADRIRQQVVAGTSNNGGQPWSELVTLGDITVDGRTVRVTLPDTPPSLLRQALMRRDSLLLLD